MPQLGGAGPRIVPANNRYRAVEKLQSALQKSRIDRATPLGPPGRAGVEQWDGAVRCVSPSRPTVCVVWLFGLDGWSPVRA